MTVILYEIMSSELTFEKFLLDILTRAAVCPRLLSPLRQPPVLQCVLHRALQCVLQRKFQWCGGVLQCKLQWCGRVLQCIAMCCSILQCDFATRRSLPSPAISTASFLVLHCVLQ